MSEKILKDYNLIFLGDINIDVAFDTSVSQSKTYQDILLGLDLKNLISRPTRITNTSETIVDHVLTNLPYDTVRSGILVSDITDHFPVFGFFNVPLKKRVFRPTYYRNFKSNRSSEFDNAFADILVLLHPDITNDFDPDEYLCSNPVHRCCCGQSFSTP